MLDVGESMTLRGKVTANGHASSLVFAGCAGGAGGAIYISAHTLDGSGSITADGGDGNVYFVRGGGGGPISLYYTTTTFTGKISARGGVSNGSDGGAGTIYTKSSA